MPRLVKPLSALDVKNAKPKTKPYSMFDGNGLYLLVAITGTKVWRLKAYLRGKDKRLTLGKYPELNLADARDKAIEYRKLIAEGKDPSVRLSVNTIGLDPFEEVAEKFIEWKKKAGQAEATIKKYRECLKNDLVPTIGHIGIGDVDTKTAVDLLESIDKRSASLAQKNKELITMVVRYAIQRGLRAQHTGLDLAGIIRKPKPKPKKMIQVDTFSKKTLPKIRSSRSPVMQYAIKLQFLCFLRSSETMGGEWAEFNLDKNEWWPDPARMKMKRLHVVPLAIQTVEALKELKELTGESKYLFPSLHNQGSMVRDSLSAIFRDLNIGQHPHACRTLFATWARNSGYLPHVVEAQLSHVEANQVAAAYQHEPHLMYLDERKKMMQAWADALLPNIHSD